MVASKAAQPQIAVVLARERIAIGVDNSWGRYSIAIRGTGAWTWRTISVITAEVAKANIVSRASSCNTDRAR